MSASDPTLPPLPDAARFALAALRAEHPSRALEARLTRALADAASRSAPLAPAPALHAPARGRRVLAGVLLCAVVGAGALVARVHKGPVARLVAAFPAREITVSLPAVGGAWVLLPWHLHSVHHAPLALVRLEGPEGLGDHTHGDAPPPEQLTHCEAGRCTHQWVASTAEPERPLRVHIPAPGRYEFRVQHASDASEADERFVVLAASR